MNLIMIFKGFEREREMCLEKPILMLKMDSAL